MQKMIAIHYSQNKFLFPMGWGEQWVGGGGGVKETSFELPYLLRKHKQFS